MMKNKAFLNSNLKGCFYLELEDNSIDLFKYGNYNSSCFFKGYFRKENNIYYLKSEEIDSNILSKIKTYLKETNIEIIGIEKFERDFSIKEMYELGKNLKNKITNNSINKDEEFINFKKIIEQEIKRKINFIQLKNAFFQFKLKTSCNFSVPGSGKTSTVLSTFFAFKSFEYINKLIVIGPKSSLISWKDEYNYCFNKEPKIALNEFFKNDIFNNIFNENNTTLANNIIATYDFIFINYDFILSNPSIIEKICFLCDNKTYLIFDESHKLKNSKSKRYENCFKIANKTEYKTFLTGTPLPNGYKDIYTTLKMMNNFEYFDFWKYNENEINNLSKFELEKFKNKLNSFYIRTTKDDLKIPKANDETIIEYKISELERKIYEKCFNYFNSTHLELYIRLLQSLIDPCMLLKNIKDEISENVDSDEKDDYDEKEIQKLFKTNNYIDPSFKDDVNFFENNLTSKMQLIIQKIIDLVKLNKKILVWSTFISPMFKIQKILSENKILNKIIYGQTSLDDRQKIIEDFKNNPEFMVLITNPQTLAESVSLHKYCHEAIYVDFSYNLVHLLQSKDRIHRLGITEEEIPNYYYFILENKELNIEDKIFNCLKEKEKLMLETIENHSLDISINLNYENHIKKIIDELKEER